MTLLSTKQAEILLGRGSAIDVPVRVVSATRAMDRILTLGGAVCVLEAVATLTIGAVISSMPALLTCSSLTLPGGQAILGDRISV